MSFTKIVLNRQSEVKEDVEWAMKNIKNMADPVANQDAATKIYVDNAITNGAGKIGAAEDGSYTDGLFTDFVPATPVGTAVDRFNEVLKSLSPSPSPAFTSVSVSQTGVSGKLSFGATNTIAGFTNHPTIDKNGAYTASGIRLGIFNASTALSGTLANNVAPNYTNSRPYPNYSFGDGDQGNLHLVVNGTTVRTIDLTSFGSGASNNANGSGFTLSAATSVAFTNGDPFTVFKYRTGTYAVAAADMRSGYNTFVVRHEYATGQYRDSQTYEWVVDSNTTATTYSAESLANLAMTGSRYLSGVNYNTGGTVNYNVSIANPYRNTYSSSAAAVNYNGTNVTITDEALPAMTTEADGYVATNKVATVSATRLLNGSLTVSTTLDRTVQSDVTSTGASVSGILVDNTADSSTVTSLTFNGEGRRINTGLSLTSTSYGSGAAGSQPSAWVSTNSLVGADANHNTGLQVYNGTLIYPKTNFSTITNGPAGNVNYSAAAGNRTFLGFFYDAAAHSNFRFNVTATSTSFVSVATGPSANNLTFEVLAPNTTQNGAGTIEWKDAVTAFTSVNSIGCYASTYGSTIPTNWGCTIGTRNTSTSGNVIVVRITASAAWTGSISSVVITWL